MATQHPGHSVSRVFCPYALCVLVLVCMVAIPVGAVTEDELRPLSAAEGTVIVHPFRDGMPLPAESQWAIVEVVGPAIFPKDGSFMLAWVVKVSPRTLANPFNEIVRVVVEDATGEEMRPLFDGGPVLQDGALMVRSPERLFTEDEYPWAFTPDDSLLIVRISLIRRNGETDVLWQPVVFDAHFKSQVQQLIQNDSD